MRKAEVFKSLGVVVAMLAVGGVWMTGCEEEGAAENSITIDAITNYSGAPNAAYQVQGRVECDDVPTITATVTANDGQPVQITVSYNQPTEKKFDLSDIAMTLTNSSNGACNGSYTLTITARTTSEVSQSIRFTVTNGVDCGTTVPVKGTSRKIYNGCGREIGTYDLVGDSLVPIAQAATKGDIRDTSTCGVSFDRKWKSVNGGKFLYIPVTMTTENAQAYDNLTTATAAVLAARADTSTLAIVGPLSVGDVVFVKMSGNRGLASIKIRAIDPTDGTSSITANRGSITFDYKYVASN